MTVQASGGPSLVGWIVGGWRRLLDPVRRWSPEWRDAALYGISGFFALFTAVLTGIPLYQQWGLMAFGPYLAGGAFMAVVAHGAAPGRGSPPPPAGDIASPASQPVPWSLPGPRSFL